MLKAVLTFHSIDDSGSVLSYPTAHFADLVATLARQNVPVVTFANLLELDRGVTLTFDDGIRTVQENALPVLKDHGFPAHLFLTTGCVGGDIGWPNWPIRYPMLDWQGVQTCHDAGMTIECHTATHPDLRILSPQQVLDECAQADRVIAEQVGVVPRYLAYPYGHYNDTVARLAAQRYAASFTTRLGYLPDAVDQQRIPRLDTYYLQRDVLRRNVLGLSTRAYMQGRALIRTLRRHH
jgi:peptidoglycan/xylan/chitin deacetylase (PgdA/CDA1 family)